MNAIIPISERMTHDYWTAGDGYWRCTNCGNTQTGGNIRVSENTWLCHVCVSNNIGVGKILDALIKRYPDVDFHISTVGRALTVRTSATDTDGGELKFTFRNFDVSQQEAVLERVEFSLFVHAALGEFKVGGHTYKLREIHAPDDDSTTPTRPVDGISYPKYRRFRIHPKTSACVCDGCRKSVMYAVTRGNFRYCEECALSPIRMPDQDEIEWLANNFVRLLGKGTAKSAIVTITAELDTFVQNVNTGYIHAAKLRDDVTRAQEGLRQMRNDPACVFDHPAHDTWKDQIQKLQLVEWWAQTKRDIATLSADDRAGRQEELAWVQQVNDLARKIDEGAIKLASWGVHPSAWQDKLKSLTDEYIQTASGGIYKNKHQLVKATVEHGTRSRAIIPVSERRTIIDVCWNAPNPVFFYPQVNVGDKVKIVKTGYIGTVRVIERIGTVNELYQVFNGYGLTRFQRHDISLCLINEPPQPLTSSNPLIEQPKREPQEGDRVKVLEGAYAGEVGTITAITRYKKRPELSFCVLSWKPLPYPASAYKLHGVELVEDEPSNIVTVSCHMCKWVHQAPHSEALEALKQHLAVHNAPAEPLPILCAECGQPVGRETVVHNKKSYCAECGAEKLREALDETLFLQKLSDAPDEDTPAPRVIEQPPQDQIPMKQLSLFGD